jgi:hypothetical protein
VPTVIEKEFQRFEFGDDWHATVTNRPGAGHRSRKGGTNAT